MQRVVAARRRRASSLLVAQTSSGGAGAGISPDSEIDEGARSTGAASGVLFRAGPTGRQVGLIQVGTPARGKM